MVCFIRCFCDVKLQIFAISGSEPLLCELLINSILKGGEVPVDKLQALQRVLQSEFCGTIREVYEHVYETVDIGGSPEVRASATAKVNIGIRTCSALIRTHCNRLYRKSKCLHSKTARKLNSFQETVQCMD